MYDQYDALIFDMDGTILDTEPTHRKAWHQVLGRYELALDESQMVGFNGAPTWRLAQFIIEKTTPLSIRISSPLKKPRRLKPCCWITFDRFR